MRKIVSCVLCDEYRRSPQSKLSPRLLELLRGYWRAERPVEWLFPGADPNRPISAKAIYLACRNAAQIAGLSKPVPARGLHDNLGDTVERRRQKRGDRRITPGGDLQGNRSRIGQGPAPGALLPEAHAADGYGAARRDDPPRYIRQERPDRGNHGAELAAKYRIVAPRYSKRSAGGRLVRCACRRKGSCSDVHKFVIENCVRRTSTGLKGLRPKQHAGKRRVLRSGRVLECEITSAVLGLVRISLGLPRRGICQKGEDNHACFRRFIDIRDALAGAVDERPSDRVDMAIG